MMLSGSLAVSTIQKPAGSIKALLKFKDDINQNEITEQNKDEKLKEIEESIKNTDLEANAENGEKTLCRKRKNLPTN